MATGTLLERLFVRVDTEYDGRGMKRADKDVDQLEGSVQALNKALNAMTLALGAAATAGIHAFTGWDSALTRLAGKAGTTRMEFDRLYGTASGELAREVGINTEVVASTYQQAHSLGLEGRAADAIVRAAAVLEASGVAMAGSVVENSVRISDYFDVNDPVQVADTIVRGAQIGVGESGDYYDAMGRVMQMAEAFGISLEEATGVLTVLTKVAPNVREGSTQFKALLAAVNNPTKGTVEGLAAIGLTPDDFKKMLGDDIAGAFEYISKFSDDQINAIFPGNREAFQMVRGMATQADLLRKNIVELENTSKGTTENMQEDREGSWAHTWKVFKSSIDNFLIKFGKPFAAMLNPILKGVNNLIDGIIKLNDSTGGLVMWIGALITGMLFLRLAIIASSKAWGLARGLFGGGGLFGGAGRAGAAGGAKGGFWKGVAGALGLTQLKEVVKSTAFISTLKRLAGLFRLLTGPVGIVVGILSALGFASSKANPDAFDPGDVDTTELDQKNNAMWMYAKGLMSAIWDKMMGWLSAGWAKFTGWLESAAMTFFTILFGESNAEKIVQALKDFMSAIAEVFAVIWNVITSPIDSIKLGAKKIAEGGLAALVWGLEKIQEAFGIESDALDALEHQADNPDQQSVDLNTGIVDDALDTTGLVAGSANGSTTISFVDNSNTNVDVHGATGDAEETGNAVAVAVRKERVMEAQRVNAEMGSFASP